MKKIELLKTEEELQELFEPYKEYRWKGNPRSHWTHYRDRREFCDDGICNRGIELFVRLIFDNGNSDLVEQWPVEFRGRKDLYKKLVKEIQHFYNIYEKNGDKLGQVSLSLPDGEDDWEEFDIFETQEYTENHK